MKKIFLLSGFLMSSTIGLMAQSLSATNLSVGTIPTTGGVTGQFEVQ